MTLKTTAIERSDEDVTYPCLMISPKTLNVWMVVDAKTGTCVHNPSGTHQMGERSTMLDTGGMEPFGGSVVLENINEGAL